MVPEYREALGDQCAFAAQVFSQGIGHAIVEIATDVARHQEFQRGRIATAHRIDQCGIDITRFLEN